MHPSILLGFDTVIANQFPLKLSSSLPIMESPSPSTALSSSIFQVEYDRATGKVWFYDFEFSFVGCPFLDLSDSVHGLHEYDDHYLRCWTQYCDMQTLRRLANLMKPLGNLLFKL